ncbi:MAG: hypothetical protein RB191_24900 [Terriglobia bacterium]|nr:hypothetical protein [Terriglobia bacterium]
MDLDYIPQPLLSAACMRAGLGRVTDIRAVRDMRKGVQYLAKYLAKGKGQRWARGVRRMQSSRGLRAPRVTEPETWEVELAPRFVRDTSHSELREAVRRRDDAARVELEAWHYDQRTKGEYRGQPSFDWKYKRGSLSQKGGTEPDSERSKRSDAAVPDGCDGATAGAARRPVPWSSLLHSLDLKKKCVTTFEVAQETVK